jgi:formate--tetrahydrofolate ligase
VVQTAESQNALPKHYNFRGGSRLVTSYSNVRSQGASDYSRHKGIAMSASSNNLPHRINSVAEKLGLLPDELEVFGKYKAKISAARGQNTPQSSRGKLILVTAMSPTPAGEGKTTTTIGLGDALCRIGKRAVICLREPSMGPVFGMKGGATGGGRSQVFPMEEINLHFTGDFAAIAAAHNLLSALIDNHIHHGNELGINPERVTWKRVVDLNDRALRSVSIGLGGKANGPERRDGFDIVVASEVMAILCLSESLAEMQERLGEIIIGYTYDSRAVKARDLLANGAMTAILKDALSPNLVQTLEGNPAIIHGGPFANIAHGCNSLIATNTALGLGDYVVTEAGFGADLGAEKFIDIKCRKSGLYPSAAVIVATVRALKYHGGLEVAQLKEVNIAALEKGFKNLERHILNMRDVFGLPCVVALNHFSGDSDEEIAKVSALVSALGVKLKVATHWRDGGIGAEDLAKEVIGLRDQNIKPTFVYNDADSLKEKVLAVATKIYRVAEVQFEPAAEAALAMLQDGGFGRLPVCIAKTPYSFSSDPSLRGGPTGHVLKVREVRLAAGAGFIVCICGDLMTMPGLPKRPASERISVDAQGRIVGLS